MPIPLKYLLECSERILCEYQLSRLDRFSALKKQARQLHEQAIDCAVEAAFAVWLREHRKELFNLSRDVNVIDQKGEN